MSAPFRVEHATRSSHVGTALFAVALVLLAAAPFWGGRDDLRLLAEIYAYVALASLWNLLAGYAGLVSVGQQAYVGLGGYVLFASGHPGRRPSARRRCRSRASVAAVVALPVAGLMFRLRGHYFAIGTWVVAEVFRLIASQVSALGGGSGISLPAGIVTAMASSRQMREFLIYWVALALVVVVLGAIVLLLRSRYGLALTAIRDNELAGALERRRRRPAPSSWSTSSPRFGTAMIGALIFLQKLRISPDTAFSVNDWTAFVIFITVIGGIGRVEGPIIGTIVFFLLRQTLADLGSLYLLMLGAVAIAVMLFAPQGHLGLRRRPLRLAAFAAGAALALYARCPHNLVQTSQRNRERTMAAKSDKVIITCAVTGAIHTPTMSDALPITPDQIAEQAIGAAEAGRRDPASACAQSAGRPPDRRSRGVHAIPAAHQAGDRRRGQHHHRRLAAPWRSRSGSPA